MLFWKKMGLGVVLEQDLGRVKRGLLSILRGRWDWVQSLAVLVCDENIFCTKRGLPSSRAESLLCVLESEIWVEYYSSNTKTHFFAQYCGSKAL